MWCKLDIPGYSYDLVPYGYLPPCLENIHLLYSDCCPHCMFCEMDDSLIPAEFASCVEILDDPNPEDFMEV